MANTIYSKEFSKKAFFEAVIALAEEAGREDIAGAAQYEIDKLAASAAKAAEKRGGAAGSKDRMASAFAGEMAKALLSVITKEPQTAEQLVAKLEGKTLSSGKGIGLNPWTYSILASLAHSGKSGANLTAEGEKNINPNGIAVKETMVKVSKTDSKGLRKEQLSKAYALA